MNLPRINYELDLWNVVVLIVGFLGLFMKLRTLEWKMDFVWRWYQRQHGMNGDTEPNAGNR